VPEPVDTTEETVEVATAEEPLVEESLVEEVSIDGMCGVY
jgi:mycofactocin precursor peptide MftA